MDIQEKFNLMVGKTITSTVINNSIKWNGQEQEFIIFKFTDGTSFKVNAYANEGDISFDIDVVSAEYFHQLN